MNDLLQRLMIGSSAVALLTAAPIVVHAQDINGQVAQVNSSDVQASQAQGGGQNVESVTVSASRITIAGYTQPTPVTVVGAEQLEKDAYADIMDSVRNLPQVTSPPTSYSATAGAGGSATAGEQLLNLRDLGVTRTLVLFDGQRVVASNISGGVDISTLPSNLIQRVDVVTGGASAVWGSDAVAGVVNFVLDKNFEGFKGNLQGGVASNGMDPNYTAQIDWGDDILGGRGHLILAASANITPLPTPLVDENWYRGAYWVSNPAYAPGNGQTNYILANNVGLAEATEGGIITASAKGASAPANGLRGIQFVGNGTPQTVNFGNVTAGTLSNGGSLTAQDSEAGYELIGLPSTNYTGFAYGSYKLTDSIQASLQLNYGDNKTISRTSGLTQSSITINANNPYIPASIQSAMQAGGIPSFTLGEFSGNNFNLSTVRPGNYFSMNEQSLYPTIFNRRQLMRGVFGLDGAIGDDWSWKAYYEHSTSNVNIHTIGNPIQANLLAAEQAVSVTSANVGNSGLPIGSIACASTLANPTNGCVPLNVFGTGVSTQSARNYITGNNLDFEDMNLNQDVAEASMQGVLPWGLPAGRVALAFGAGYRQEQAVARATIVGTNAGFAGANYSNFPSASYHVYEGFAEVNAPLLKDNIVESLDFDGAGRMTDYSTSGLVETWKLGLTSQVNDDVRLRTSWSVDIRAPQLNELFTQGSINTGTYEDPRTNLTTMAADIVKGNPNLLPEVARTFSVGAVVTPSFIPGLTLSADWYSIRLTGEINTISTTTILNECNPTLASTIYPGQKGDPNNSLCSALVFNGPNGALSQIVQQPINIAWQTTSGLDLAANYTMDFWEGVIDWAANANLDDENTIYQPGAGTNDSIGSAGIPKWRGVISADYIAGPYSFTVQGRWFGSNIMTNTADTGNLATSTTQNWYPLSQFTIPFVAYLDLRGSYRWNKNILMYAAIDNVTDVPPPLIPLTYSSIQAQGGLTGTAPTTYDLLGRVFRLGVRFVY